MYTVNFRDHLKSVTSIITLVQHFTFVLADGETEVLLENAGTNSSKERTMLKSNKNKREVLQ